MHVSGYNKLFLKTVCLSFKTAGMRTKITIIMVVVVIIVVEEGENVVITMPNCPIAN